MYREREKESCLIFAYMNHYTPNFNLNGSGKYTKSNTPYIPVLSHCLVLSAIEAFESNNHWQLPDVFLYSLSFVCWHLLPSSDQLNLSGIWVQKRVCKLHQIHPLMEFMYLVYTCIYACKVRWIYWSGVVFRRVASFELIWTVFQCHSNKFHLFCIGLLNFNG